MSVPAINLDTVRLDAGGHRNPSDGHCLMEVVSMFAREPFSDQPACVSPVLRSVGIRLNDRATDQQRQDLRRFIPLVVGTAGDGLDEQRRWLAVDHATRMTLPMWLDAAGMTTEAEQVRALTPITDRATNEAARLVVLPIRGELAKRRIEWRSKLQAALRAELAKRGPVAAADADADAVAAAVADAVAAAAAAAVADADADAVAAAVADAVAAAAAVADAVAVAAAVADAVADYSYGSDGYWRVRAAVEAALKPIVQDNLGHLIAAGWDDALSLYSRLISPRRRCRMTYQRYEIDIDDLTREIDWIGDTDTPENIARRLGYTLGSLTMRLRREGRPSERFQLALSRAEAS